MLFLYHHNALIFVEVFLKTPWSHPIPVIIPVALLDSSKSETSHFKLHLLALVLDLETVKVAVWSQYFYLLYLKMGYTTENVLNGALLSSFH